MNLIKPSMQFAATAAITIAMIPASVINAEPQPVVILTHHDMPKMVPEQDIFNHDVSTYDAVKLYHELRESFGISHTTMGNWLGVKRRTLYNWMNQTSKVSKLGEQIEARLSQLDNFRTEIEPEHIRLVNKIAYSPIYGNPEFGMSIINGDTSTELLRWYDRLFSRFESYKIILDNTSKLS